MLFGIVITKGKVVPASGKSVSEILREEVCAVIYDDRELRIYLWIGSKADIRSRFLSARLTSIVKHKAFGGAGRVIQNKSQIQRELGGVRISRDIPLKLLSRIR